MMVQGPIYPICEIDIGWLCEGFSSRLSGIGEGDCNIWEVRLRHEYTGHTEDDLILPKIRLVAPHAMRATKNSWPYMVVGASYLTVLPLYYTKSTWYVTGA